MSERPLLPDKIKGIDFQELLNVYRQNHGKDPDSMWLPLEDGTIFATGLFTKDGKDAILPAGTPCVMHEPG